MASSIDSDGRTRRASAPTAPHPQHYIPHEICTATRSGRVARWTNTHRGQTHRRSTRSGPHATPQSDHVTSKRGPPADFVHMTGRPHHGMCGEEPLKASAIQSPHLRDRRLDEVDDAYLTRGRLGRLRATAIPSAPPPAQPVHHLGGRLRFGARLAISARISSYMHEISERTFGGVSASLSFMTSMYPTLAGFSSSTCSSLNLGQPRRERRSD
jgi:hypothetical protein